MIPASWGWIFEVVLGGRKRILVCDMMKPSNWNPSAGLVSSKMLRWISSVFQNAEMNFLFFRLQPFRNRFYGRKFSKSQLLFSPRNTFCKSFMWISFVKLHDSCFAFLWYSYSLNFHLRFRARTPELSIFMCLLHALMSFFEFFWLFQRSMEGLKFSYTGYLLFISSSPNFQLSTKSFSYKGYSLISQSLIVDTLL